MFLRRAIYDHWDISLSVERHGLATLLHHQTQHDHHVWVRDLCGAGSVSLSVRLVCVLLFLFPVAASALACVRRCGGRLS